MPETQRREPSKTELAGYIKAIWSALLEPSWTYDELVILGKMVYSKVPLAKVDDSVMKVLLPKLMTIAHRVATSEVVMNPVAPAPTADPPEAP